MLPDDEMIEVFKRFHALRHESADKFVRARFVRQSDFEFPGRTHRNFMSFMFFDLARNFTCGLIGELNRFLVNINHADCWFEAVQNYQEARRMGLLWEFVDPHIELAVSRPYSLKNHFVFAAVYLLHYSNQLKNTDWKDDLPPDDRINFKLLDKVRLNWARFQNFKESIEALHSKGFQNTTRNFRHRLQHRYRSHFDFGLTPFIDRVKTENGISYAYKVIPPLELKTLIPVLYEQHQVASKVFQAYWELISELSTEWEKNM